MADKGEQESNTTQWCLGLPLIAEVPLNEEEKRYLRREALLGRFSGCLLAMSVPVAFIAVLLAMTFASESHKNDIITSTSLGLIGIGLVALLVIKTRECARRAKSASKDLGAGITWHFAGPLPSFALLEKSGRQLIKLALINPDQPNQEMVVFPSSQHVWRVNGRQVDQYIIAPCGVTTNPPAIARIAANWLDPIAKVDDAIISTGQREISDNEKVEMRAIARTLWLRPLWPAVILSLWGGLLIRLGVFHDGPKGFADTSGCVLVFALMLTSDLRFILSLPGVFRMYRDIQRGLIVIVSRSFAENTANTEVAEASKELTIEMLPDSNIIWTIEGKPASWRRRLTHAGKTEK